MKTVLAIMMTMSMMVFASYTYEIKDGDYFGVMELTDSQSIHVTGGGGYHLNLFYNSQAVIENTSILKEYEGGIWQIIAADYSDILIGGGEIHRLDLGAYATAVASGGQIDILRSSQNATYTKHIEIICRDWEYNTTTKLLSGIWEDYSIFNIHLEDVSGTSPTIDNIKFTIIPEPASMLLLAAGGLFLRQRRK